MKEIMKLKNITNNTDNKYLKNRGTAQGSIIQLKHIAKEIINPPHIKSEGEGNIKILSTSAINALTVNKNKFSLGKTEKDIKNLLLKKGDILFLAKGNKFDAAIVDEDSDDMVPSQLFFIIRIEEKLYNPKFITWYLKSKSVKRYLDKFTTGNTVKTLRRKVLENIEIPSYIRDKQDKIVELIESFENEKKITLEYLDKKERLIEEKIEKFIRDTKDAKLIENEFIID
jgi:restriction endonuclease S subunit